MRVLVGIIKILLFAVWLMLALVWMIFFGAFGVACFASVLLAPLGIAAFGLATMPLFTALAWAGWRHGAHSQQVIVNVQH